MADTRSLRREAFELLQATAKIMMVDQAVTLNKKVNFMEHVLFEEKIKVLSISEINQIIMEISLWSASKECVDYTCKVVEETQLKISNNLLPPDKMKVS